MLTGIVIIRRTIGSVYYNATIKVTRVIIVLYNVFQLFKASFDFDERRKKKKKKAINLANINRHY